MDSTNLSHDEFFKRTFSNIEVARDYLRRFLPGKLYKRLRLETLSHKPGSFVGPKLKGFHADLLFECEYGGKRITIPILLEHKSHPVKYPHLQLLQYMLLIWKDQEKNKLPLTPILPLIVYHGKTRWKNKPFSKYLMGMDEELMPYTPNFSIIQNDIGSLPLEVFEGLRNTYLKNILYLLKECWGESDFQTVFRVAIGDLHSDEKRDPILNEALTFYFFSIYRLKTPEEQELAISTLDDSLKEKIMPNYLDVLLERGHQQGLELGLEQGLEQGLEKGKLEELLKVIRRSLSKGYPIEEIADLTELSVAEVESLIRQYLQG